MLTLSGYVSGACILAQAATGSLASVALIMTRCQTLDADVSQVLAHRMLPRVHLSDVQALRQTCRALQVVVQDVHPDTWARMAR